MLLNYFPASLPVSFFSCCRFFLILVSITLLGACESDTGQNDDTTARTVPQNVTLTTGTRINEVNWSGVSGARGYTVYWSTEPGVTPTTGTAIDTQQPYLEHRGLANGITYYYVITSDTDFGQSAPSTVVEGTPRAARPARPGDLTLKAGNGRITLRWDAVPGATHYTLYWKDSAGISTDEDTTDARITQVVSPFVHPGLENGRDYFYRLVAENAHGASDASTERSTTPVLPSPGAPQITRADVAFGQVTLHWQHTGIASQYELYWSTTPLGDNATDNNVPLTRVTSPYTHAPLQDGQTYYYRVRTRSGDRVSALSNALQVTPPGEASVTAPGPVPTMPVDVTISLENGQLSLDWPPVDGAQGYNLYWTTDETGDITPAHSRITRIQSPYTHIQLNNGTRYRYRLSALNNHGESALSSEVNGTPQVVIPGVPAGVQALAGDESILVRWNPVQDATSYTLTTDDGTVTNTLADVRSPYHITGLNNATAYQIRIQAQNTQGLSDPSTPVTATPQEPVPNAPNTLVARPGNAEVLLQWAAATPQNADDPNETITAYRVYTATHPGVRPDNSTLINATPTSNDDGRWQLRHTALQNGQRYFYVVSAQNAGGEGGLSPEVWARPRVSTPGVPGSLSAEAGNGQVRIDFTPPDNSESSTTYNLYWTRSLDEGRSSTEVISNVEPGYLFRNGEDTNGTTYFFRVSTVNNGNESPPSDEVSATPQIPAPGQAPQDAQTLTSSAQVTLDWAPVAQASGYVIYWATEPDIDPQTSNRLSGEAIQPGFVHDGLDNGQSYFYRIAAINAGGESTLSALLAAQPQVPPPANPTDFDVQPGDGQVIINFALTPTATGYRVFWHPDVEAPLAQWSSRTIQPGDTLTDLDNNQTWFYRLQALNAGGSSPLTTVISATPQPNPPATPTGLAIVTGDTELNITWHTQPGLQYTLYWSDDPEIAPRDSNNALSGTRPTYRHTGLNSETTYYYQVSASNSGGEGPASEPAQAIPGNGTPDIPDTPQNVQGSTGDGQNTLQWQAIIDAEQYTVQWSTQADMSNPQSTTVSTPFFVHEEPSASILYYQVIAQNSAGDGPPSTIVEIVQDSPNQAPQIIQGATTTVTMDEDSSPTAFTLTLNATDNDGDALTWTIATPANRGTAQINSNNDMATVSYIPQANINGSDTFIVQVDDGQGGSDSIQINVNITPQNDAPTITNTNLSPSVVENTTAVTAITVTDIDSTGFTYTLGGADNASFSMVGNTLTFIAAPDFENPQDSGGDNIYNLSVIANDGDNDSTAAAFTITVKNTNDVIPQITNATALSLPEQTIAITAITVSDADSTAFTYTLSGTDSALFSLTGNTLRFIAAPDFESPQDSGGDNVYNLTVVANDGSNDSAAKVFVITVTDTNDIVPMITNSNLAPEIEENTTTVTAITITDTDSTAFTYTLSGTDSALFNMAGNTLRFTTAPDFENPQDNGSDNTYNVSVTANDGTNDSTAAAFVITVTDANDSAPVITNTNLSPSVVENTTAVTAITVTDTDSTIFTYTLGGVDNALFTITGNSLHFTAAPNFETPQDSGSDNIYNVSVTANDGTNNSAIAAFAIMVTDTNDSAPVITNPNPNLNIVENTTAVTAITVTDVDTGSTAFTYTLGGVDGAMFSVIGNTLHFTAAPDFDIPQDSGADNIYNVSVTANDGTNNSAAVAFTITVTDANDLAPVITNSNLAPGIAENTTAVTIITVTDADSTTFTYTLSGADSERFSMLGNSLRFITAPDFETPQDSGGDNIYNVSVTANDGTNNSATVAFAITVTDTNDSAPVITNSNLALGIVENTTAVTAITVTDADSTTFTYTLSGADSGRFSMTGNSLRFTAAPDFETPQDNGGDNIYNVSVTANDGTNNSATAAFAITVTDTNDTAPVITNSNLAPGIAENTTAVTTITVTDADSTIFTFTLDGTDSALFTITGNSLHFITAPDFENPQDSDSDNLYDITITASDGSNESAAIAFVITVTNVDDSAPVITLNGANPVTIIQGTTYVDAGASATDDTDDSVEVLTSGSVDTSTIGIYTITYTATDTAGNISTATRAVNVIADVASPFVTTWKTDNPGITADNQIRIGTSGEGYNYTVDWGDGQTDNNVAGDITHTYATAGTYTVSITGDFPRIIFGLDTDAEKLLSIEQWGSNQWQSMNNAFFGCRNLVGNARDVPDLSQVTDMSGMFLGANAFNQDINTWDVSAVTDMSGIFRSAIIFNQNLGNWDVSSVTDMSRMFNNAIAFNQDLSTWDVSSVTEMFDMFDGARAFNQNLNDWNVSSVTNMSRMFSMPSSSTRT